MLLPDVLAMLTPSESTGSAEPSWMVNGPVPGMSKLMASAPGLALAAATASRRVHSATSQTPLPGSFVELTTKTVGVGVGVGVAVGVGVGVAAGVGLGVGVAVGVGVGVG